MPPVQPHRPGAIHGWAASTSMPVAMAHDEPGSTIGTAARRWSSVRASAVMRASAAPPTTGAPPSAIAV